MEHWEFLLQKEGDRSWLPLDSPDVEILEGRYRIVARSNNVNATIDTRIAHLATAEVPPKRRVQKRSCRTNHDGLMVVIPFTHLEPGQWELSCSPADLMTDLITGAQPYAIKLQVVAQESEEDWEHDWTSPHTLSVIDASQQAQDAMPTSERAAAPTNEVESASVDTQAFAASVADASLSNATKPDQPETLSPANTLPPEVAEILAASMDRLFQVAEQMSERLVDDILQDFDLATIADAPTSIDAVETLDPASDEPTTMTPTASVNRSDEPDAISDRPSSVGYTLAANETFVLTLNQSAFVAARGEVITLSGQVSVAPMPSPSPHDVTIPTLPEDLSHAPWETDISLNLVGATAQEVQLCLRDPQSLQVLVSDRQRLSQSSLPYSFTFSFSLPETFVTHLVLGEVLLHGTLAEPVDAQTESAIALLTQAFSITVDPNALVGELTKLHEALTIEVDDEDRIDLPLELTSRLKEQATPSIDLSFLNLAVVEPPPEQPPRFPSLAGQPLPPRLYQPDPDQARSKALDLPVFKLTTEVTPLASEDAALNLETPEQTPSTDLPSASIAIGDTVAADKDAKGLDSPPDQLGDTAGTKPPKPVDAETLKDVNTDSTESTPLDLPSPTHMAFQSLKLQDRFLTRLASLATDTELSAMLKANLAPGSPSPSATAAPFDAEARSLSDEIVVDDVPPQNERRRNQPTHTSEPVPLSEPPSALVLSADDPVPMPTLDVTTGELTAGKPINIRVKLPNLLPRIYVKLWITDRQTRSLLDGPRWLVDFLPNGLGDLEAMMPLTVPFGSVKLRFEAIAVEMHTQRESHKVTIDRLVVPPDLPNVSLDDFSD